ncbi:MAG: ribonuclease catalytic domain-containing protein, partial [Nitrososphaeraceae archaeon]|nr:ribonuclease catalytic domain-containing protein [Nitrososphaeraceae archaeon]
MATIIGKVHIQNQSYTKATVSDNKTSQEILTFENINRAFHGDTVEINNNKITQIIKSDIKSKQIVGTLIFKTKYKYGYNQKHMELFLFRPLSNHYPSFLVASKNRYDMNQYAIIQFLKWDSKWPTGQLMRIIGDTDTENNTYEAIIYKNNLNTVSCKFNKSNIPQDFDPVTFFDDLQHNNITTQYVFSVDPKGCEDIDDAFSIIKYPDHYIVNIHIADVSFYLDYFNIEIKRYSTIYAPHKNYSMIPDIFANNICSLRPNKNRLAFTVSVKLDLNGIILSYSFEKTIINSKKAYDYDELQYLIDNNQIQNNEPSSAHRTNVRGDSLLQSMSNNESHPSHSVAPPLRDESDLYHVGKLMCHDSKDNYDTHKMVEVFMILANNLVGKYLYEKTKDKYKKKIVFRVHEKNQNDNTKLTGNKEIDTVLELLESNAAIYTNEHTNYYHSGLKIDYYTHFTSPIRRYVDIYIHKLLNCVITDQNKIEQL